MHDDKTTVLGVDASSPLMLVSGLVGERRALEPGATVEERYQVLSLLGQGGMGRVWLAEDLQEKRRVALKEMQVPVGLSAAEVEELTLLFRREFFAMKRLQHPNTVKVYDCGQTESGNRYITMEVVDGQDLSQLARERPLDTRFVYRVLLQLAQVLGFVHSRLYVHSDIKASNVRITGSGSVKLMDFGIMHQLGTPGSGRVRGTMEYLAPEWQRGTSIDGRADLYSLGVMAFYLVAGRLPFSRKEVSELLADHLHRAPPRPSALASVEPALEAIILRLLEKEPRERFQDATELMEALSRASGEPLPEEPLAARASYLHLPEVVGREQELAWLGSALSRARQARARAVLVGAPAGVGKSRLLQEFELQGKLAELPYGVGQCRAEGLAPLAPITQALRTLVPLTPAELLVRVRRPLGRLVPSLATGAPPPAQEAGEEKLVVLGALTEWLQGLARVRPFILCFEDIHWADAASLEYLNVIIRALHGTSGLVVATYRSDELNRLGLAFQTVDEGLTDRMELTPLSASYLYKLVRLALTGFTVPTAFVQRLHQNTGGNAFFATECLRALVEEGALKRVGGRWSVAEDLARRSLPTTIAEAVRARLATVPPERVALLQRLAPAGRAISLPLVRALAELPEPELFEALEDFVERQFLLMQGGQYIFTHDTVHRALYESTPEALRRTHHGRIAEELLRLGGERPELARAVGYHFARSHEPQRAIEPLLRAGHFSREANALLDATLLLKEAAGLLEASPPSPERTARLVHTWGTLIEVGYTSDTPTSLLFAEKLFSHWERTVDLEAGREQALARLALARAAPACERAERLRELFRSLPLEGPLSPADVFWKRAELQILQSIALAIMGRTSEFNALQERVRAEHPPDSPYRAGAHIALAGLSSHTGRFAGVIEIQSAEVERLRAHRDEVGRPSRRLAWALGMGCYFLNMNHALKGEPLDEAATRDGFAVAEDFGFTELRIYHLFSQIVRASFTGNGAAFVPTLSEKTELTRRLGNPRLPERNLAIYTPPYYLEREEHELVEAIVAKGERLAEVLPGDRWLRLYVEVYRACRDVLFGREEARQSLPRALEAARAADFRMETLVRVYQSRFERGQGRLEEAREAAEAALARATDPVLANPFDEILARRALAPLLPAEEAGVHYARALAVAERSENVLQQGLVQLERAVLRVGASGEAAAALEAAERALTAARAPGLLPRVEALRRTLPALSGRGTG